MSVRDRVAEARRQLMRIPGVVRVGYGYKQRAGVTTQELSLRVYVRAKRSRSSLSPDEIVPAEVNGLKTDVIELRPSQLLACESIRAVSPLVGGVTVTNLKAALAGSGGLARQAIGTLGFLGTLNDVGPRDNIALLSNRHVLGADGGAVGDMVYNPELTPTSGGNFSIDAQGLHPIGEIYNLGMMGQHPFTYPGAGETEASYFIDCASAKVSTNYSSWCHTNVGTTFDIRIHDLDVGGASTVEGVARITEDDLHHGSDYTVVKVGRTTGKTTGKVVDTHAPFTLSDPPISGTNVISIENTGPNCESGTAFADHGDSGSVVVNSERKVIGLLFGGSPAPSPSTGLAAHIHPVLDRMGMMLLSTTNNPAAAGASTLAEVGAPSTETGGAAVARAAALRADILASERGRMYRALVGKHLHEFQHLINRVRPVTVAWHRLHGPDFAAHMIHASRHADHDVPRALQGRSRGEAFAALLGVLEQHGSAAMRDDIAAYADQLRRLLDSADNIEALSLALRAS